MSAFWPCGAAPACESGVISEIADAATSGDHVLLFVHPDAFSQAWLDELAAALPDDCQLFGMSVAGALGSGVLSDDGLSWMVLPGDQVAVAATHTTTPSSADDWRLLADRLLEQERGLAAAHPAREGAIVLFATGRDRSEEHMASQLYLLFPALPLVGGSAGATVGQENTFVIIGNRVLPNDHLVLLLRSALPLDVFQHHHFEPRGEKVVVTACDDDPRIVTELDGRPALQVVAELLDCTPEEVDVARCSEYPFGVRLRGQWYIRSIMDVTAQGALQFACEVHVGTVMSVMQPVDLVGSLQRFLPSRPVRGGLLFHCLGRYFEAVRTGNVSPLAEQLRRIPIAGGNTFGEQYMGLHLNHTLTGLWFREKLGD